MKLIDRPVLPKNVFASPVAPEMLSQAVRVHLANQRQGTQNAKTRAEIARTRKKLYKQKGTGGARHGDRRAPIFVGGGIAFAPKPRDHALKLPVSMRRKAIFGALTGKVQSKSVLVFSGMTDLSGKTSELAGFLKKVEIDPSKKHQNLLLLTDLHRDNVIRAARNLAGVTVISAELVNPYEIIKADKIILMEEAIETINPENSKKSEVTPRHFGERSDSRIAKSTVVKSVKIKGDSGRATKSLARMTVEKSTKTVKKPTVKKTSPKKKIS